VSSRYQHSKGLKTIMRSFPAIYAATFLLTGLSFSGLTAGSAVAAEPGPVGEWRVANGLANIRIDDCDGVLWGIISWEKEPGVDSYNPDPSARNRPTLGLHILRGMKPTKPGLWQGQVYNAEDGRTYDSKISLSKPDVLRIEGCILGFLCGGEDWTRVKSDPAAPPKPAATAQRPGRKESPPPSACAGLPK
jgi:uncharacterized protein (DUF2147 family)